MIETTTPATGPGQRLLDRIADIAIYGAVAALLGLVVVVLVLVGVTGRRSRGGG